MSLVPSPFRVAKLFLAGIPAAWTTTRVHEVADQAGVPWDNDEAFMLLCQGLVGKMHLDDMSSDELEVVATHLLTDFPSAARVAASGFHGSPETGLTELVPGGELKSLVQQKKNDWFSKGLTKNFKPWSLDFLGV